MKQPRPTRILLVTGMSGAGKSTALDTLEDLGWEVVDNLPLLLLNRLLATDLPQGAIDARPLAFGIDSRTRGFDCGGAELERRFSETRRRHPLALDRPAADGIARERELMAPLRRWADHVVDTTSFSSNALKGDIRARFGDTASAGPTLSVMSFGFARGVPRNADLMFDMRFLRNPHWIDDLRPMSGLDQAVVDYIACDPAYEDVAVRIEELLILLIPRYQAEGKSYVSIALGCTGGRHRSVHMAERIARRLRDAAFSPTVTHRDLASRPDDMTEGGGVHGGGKGTLEQQ